MKIISVILTFIGFVLCLAGSVGSQYFLRVILAAMISSETSGIGAMARGFDNAMLSGYVAIFGCAIIFLGLLISVISLFTGRKQQTI
ncbi:MAG: hypothetical protein WA584_11845 [Pyrinomonadaceae bacterium]